jgi:beta-glucosidase
VADGDLGVIAAPIDFLGINYYTREMVRSPHLDPLPVAPAPELTGMGWEVYPEGLTETLGFVASRTGELPLYVTENGAAYPDDPEDPRRDPERVAYLRRHLLAALAAIDDGVPLKGYFAWSLLDNFEWGYGYDQRFGVVHVDFATQQRTVRDSARYLAEVARSGSPA